MRKHPPDTGTMANNIRRSQSSTSISTKSNRPLSRASTTSIHSFDQHDQSHDLQPQAQYQQPQHPANFAQQYNASYAPMESALLQDAQHASQQEQGPRGPGQALLDAPWHGLGRLMRRSCRLEQAGLPAVLVRPRCCDQSLTRWLAALMVRTKHCVGTLCVLGPLGGP